MKSIISFLFLFLFISANSIFAQWVKQNSGTTNRFLTCYFLDENTGWAAGDSGTIVKTTNGGLDWFSQSITTSDDIHNIFFIDSLNGWIALFKFEPDRHGSVMHTSNGGKSWVTQLTESGATFHTVYFTDIDNGYAVGSSGILYKTTNSGDNWSFVSPVSGYWLYSCYFFSATIGWVGGGLEGSLLRTINGGQDWSLISVPTNERLMCIKFVNDNYGWACGAGGEIIRTTNGGSDWMLGNTDVSDELRSIQFINQNDGWSVGLNGKIIYSSDGGINWFQLNSGTNYNLYGVSFADDLIGWAVGDSGLILKTTEGGLPVELTSFSGFVSEDKITLNWNTATEINNSGFEIERKDINSEFITIGFKSGFGTTTESKSYTFTDVNVQPGTYSYRLKQIDYDGSFEYSDEILVEVQSQPSLYSLSQNYPNPFNPSTVIDYSVEKSGLTSLKVYNIQGQEVLTLVNSFQEAGNHRIVFKASKLASGVYYYQLKAGEFTSTRKLILIK